MKNKVVLVVLFVITFFFIGRHSARIGVSAVSTLSSCFLYPVLRLQQSIVEPLKTWMAKRVTVAQLEKELMRVQKDRDELLAQSVALKATACYAHDIAELLDFNKRYAVKNNKIGHVLARHFSQNNQFFLLDVGSLQGIKKDMVAVYSNCLVGKVVQVYPWYCKVCLITDAECKVAAMCAKTRVSGIHEGINETNRALLQHVSHLHPVMVGDIILSSGEGLIFPTGFALGTIRNALRGEIFYEIDVEPLVDFHSLRYCTLIAKDEIGVMSPR
jgi:rod shape-determining protein MreC